jgi:hypothetical protein
MKKFLIYIQIFALVSFINPVQADIDPQNMTGTALAAAGSLTTYLAVASAAPLVIGTGGLALAAVGVAILLSNDSDPTTANANKRISVQLNPNVPLVTPQNWVNPTTPPSTTPFEQKWQSSTLTGFESSEAAALAAWKLNTFHCSPPKVCTVGNLSIQNPTLHRYTVYSNGGMQGTINATLVSTCPTGYTLQNGSCNLTNQPLVKKPVKGLMEIKRVGNNFELDPQINPKDVLPNQVVSISPSEVNINDATGKKTQVKINPDGTTNVKVSAPQPDGTTQETTTQFSNPDPSTGDVQVIGNNTQSVSGNGTLQTTGNGSNIDISSLNKESTQQNISSTLNEIKDKISLECTGNDCTNILENIDNKANEIGEDTDSITGAIESYTNGYDDNKTYFGWSTWVPDFPQSSCQPFTGALIGKTVVIDMCSHIGFINETLGWLFNLFGAWTIMSLFFTKKD